MASTAERHTGVLVLSAWHEGEPPVLTARVTHTVDVTEPDRVTVTAAGLDAINSIVRQWLHEVDARRRH